MGVVTVIDGSKTVSQLVMSVRYSIVNERYEGHESVRGGKI